MSFFSATTAPAGLPGIVEHVVEHVIEHIIAGGDRFFAWTAWQFDRLLCAALRDDAHAPHTDEQLMALYVAGDGNAFKELFTRYAPGLLRAARRKGLSDAESQDAVQQTFVHVHQGRDEFSQGSKVAPWIFTIGFNVMRDYGRRASAHWRMKSALRAEPADPVTMPGETEAASPVSSQTIETALAHLSNEQREVIWLHYFESLSFAEIARVQGCNAGAVRARAHRGYEKLRDVIPRLQKAASTQEVSP